VIFAVQFVAQSLPTDIVNEYKDLCSHY